MDAREYRDGAGQIKVRAKIKIKDDSTVVIKEIPPTTTTESLIASIEDASRKGKIKVKSINDFTAEEVEIEVKAPGGVSADQLVDALFAFTDCEVTIASRIIVIRDNRPVEMTVSDVLARKHGAARGRRSSGSWSCKAAQLQQELHFRRSSASSSRSASTSASSNARPTRRYSPRCTRVSSRSERQLVRDLADRRHRDAPRRPHPPHLAL